MRAIAHSVRCITIVGDPDQSSEHSLHIVYPDHSQRVLLVYGWRAAEVENLAKMKRGMRPSLYQFEWL